MSELPSNHELARQLAVLEERMKTMQAEYKTYIARLAEIMAKRDAEAAKRDAEAAKRDKDNLRWIVGLWIAAVVIVGVLVRWPG